MSVFKTKTATNLCGICEVVIPVIDVIKSFNPTPQEIAVGHRN